jgi:uncharacterized protein
VIVVLRRITAALERLTQMPSASVSLREADAFVWEPPDRKIRPVRDIGAIDLRLLKGVDRQANTLLENTRRFARGLPANNALLWGARGSGKSSLVKAVHARVAEEQPGALVLIEVHRDDIATMPQLLTMLRNVERRCVLFCDDLSFHEHDASYRSLKAALEGGIEDRPDNVLVYATSNRRHLMPREMIENERSTAINPAEAVEEQVSLSDRFGLWLGFHACDQATYLDIVEGYASHYDLDLPPDRLRSDALAWSMARGARSGRVAWQFIQDLAARLGKRLERSARS